MADPRHVLGRDAERRVSAWLAAHDWQILAERHRTAAGEIDLVALDGDRCLVAVEVKVRRSGRAGLAADAIRPTQVRRLRAALASYARATSVDHRGLRIDLVAVSPGPEPRTWHLTRLPGVDAW